MKFHPRLAHDSTQISNFLRKPSRCTFVGLVALKQRHPLATPPLMPRKTATAKQKNTESQRLRRAANKAAAEKKTREREAHATRNRNYRANKKQQALLAMSTTTPSTPHEDSLALLPPPPPPPHGATPGTPYGASSLVLPQPPPPSPMALFPPEMFANATPEQALQLMKMSNQMMDSHTLNVVANSHSALVHSNGALVQEVSQQRARNSTVQLPTNSPDVSAPPIPPAQISSTSQLMTTSPMAYSNSALGQG